MDILQYGDEFVEVENDTAKEDRPDPPQNPTGGKEREVALQNYRIRFNWSAPNENKTAYLDDNEGLAPGQSPYVRFKIIVQKKTATGWDNIDTEFTTNTYYVYHAPATTADLLALYRAQIWTVDADDQLSRYWFNSNNGNLILNAGEDTTPGKVLLGGNGSSTPGTGTIGNITQFADNIRPVAIGNGAPTSSTPGTGVSGSFYYDQSSNTLWKYTNSWGKAIGANDIVAKSITAGQIAAGAISTTELNAINVEVRNLSTYTGSGSYIVIAADRVGKQDQVLFVGSNGNQTAFTVGSGGNVTVSGGYVDFTGGLRRNGVEVLGGAAGSTTLAGLSDTNINSPSGSQVLRYLNGKWTNITLSVALGELAGGGATNGEFLKWNGSTWVPASVAPVNISSGGASTGDILSWNGSIWTPVARSTITGSGTTLPSGSTAGQWLRWNGSSWVAAGTGSGEIELNIGQLNNVDIAGSTTGSLLRWNGSQWADATPATVGGDIPLGQLKNVAISGATTGQLLRWNGTNWINDSINLGMLNNVNISNALDGQMLRWNGTNWTNQTINLGTLNNVAIQGGIDGQHLVWNGNAWINRGARMMAGSTNTTAYGIYINNTKLCWKNANGVSYTFNIGLTTNGT